MDKLEVKNSMDITEEVNENNHQLTEEQWRLIKEVEAEYEKGSEKSDRTVKIWLESMHYLHS